MTNIPDRIMHPGPGDAIIAASGDVNGVTVVKETIGVVFLGFLAMLLLVALLQSHARNRELLARLDLRDRSQE